MAETNEITACLENSAGEITKEMCILLSVLKL